MDYQRKLSKLDQFLIWYYTYDSKALNCYLLCTNYTRFEMTQFVGLFFLFAKIFNVENELLHSFDIYDKCNTTITNINNEKCNISLYNLYFKMYKFFFKSLYYKNMITCKNNISNIIDILYNNSIEYLDLLFENFIKFYSIRLNKIIINSPKFNSDITVYKVINLNIEEVININKTKCFNSVCCSIESNFFEYVNNVNDTHTFTFMEITIKKKNYFLFTNRINSFFGSESHEIILPYGINLIYNKSDTIQLCGYIPYWDYITTDDSQINLLYDFVSMWHNHIYRYVYR
jgi:hypothetical protein